MESAWRRPAVAAERSLTRFAVLVEVSLRPGIADPQGATIERALPALGFERHLAVRAGKSFRFMVDADDEEFGPVGSRGPLQPIAGQPGHRGFRGDRGAGALTARIGVVLFPGSNCEYDVMEALGPSGPTPRSSGTVTSRSGRSTRSCSPGGFAHGDYLRPGAIARFSPIMAAVAAFAADGGPVVGICNGFQVLTEAQLLPGALQKNRGLSFLCAPVDLDVTSDQACSPAVCPPGPGYGYPINHFEGNYTCDAATLAELRREDRIVLRYVDNPNGSVDDIAGICNRAGNVVGLMPHPERASDPLLGSTDGLVLLRALVAAAGEPAATLAAKP